MLFRKRQSTYYICVETRNTGCKDLTAYYRCCRRDGDVDTGYHYYISPLGEVEADRAEDCVAGWHHKDSAVSIYILAESTNGKLNDAQSLAFSQLLAKLLTKYPKAILRTEEV